MGRGSLTHFCINFFQWSIRAPSNFGRDPWPVRRGLVAAVRCCVRKTFFFCFPGRFWNRKKKPEWVLAPQRRNPVFRPTITYGIGQQKAKQDFPSSCRNPRAVPSVVMGHFCTPPTEKNVFFAHSTNCCHESASHRGRITLKVPRMYAPLL